MNDHSQNRQSLMMRKLIGYTKKRRKAHLHVKNFVLVFSFRLCFMLMIKHRKYGESFELS